MTKICGIFYCDNDADCKDLCSYHYQQDYRRKNRFSLLEYEQNRRLNPERMEYIKNIKQKIRKKINEKQLIHYYANKEAYNRQNKKYRDQIKRKTLSHYSKGKLNCNCCGESTYEFLTIDHIHNNGNEQPMKERCHLHRWLLKRNFPAGFQVLCWNCNCGKRLNKGVCPHNITIKEPKLRKRMK